MKKTHTKPEETLEVGTTKRKQNFSFGKLLNSPEKWMIGVTFFSAFLLLLTA